MVTTQPTTDQLRSTAIDALHAWHHAHIRSAADDILDDVRCGTLVDWDAVNESIAEWCESLVTYTFNAQLHLTASRHDDAYLEEYGADGIVQDGAVQWERLAYAALDADIRDQLGDRVDELFAAFVTE
jgi:hypothetical protein